MTPQGPRCAILNRGGKEATNSLPQTPSELRRILHGTYVPSFIQFTHSEKIGPSAGVGLAGVGALVLLGSSHHPCSGGAAASSGTVASDPPAGGQLQGVILGTSLRPG